MTISLFCTGITGYIGGDFLVEVTRVHPEWKLTCLVRDDKKKAALTAAFPHMRVVAGSLDSADIIEAEVEAADITFHFANCDHIASAKAIARGIAKRSHTKPAYWIHTSGAGILTFNNFASDSYGHTLESDRKVFDDWENVNELTDLPPQALHRHVDRIVLAASGSDPTRIKTAIVCPPCIYGEGRGPGNQRSVQIYLAAEIMLRHNKAVKVGNGTNIWNAVHVQDLSKLYVLLAEAALFDPSRASWNQTGYYLAEQSEFVWGDLIQNMADEASRRGYLSSNEVYSVDKEEALALHRWLPYLIGTTSRGRSQRAQKLLGWRPMMRSVYGEVPNIVSGEIARLKHKSNRL